MSMWNEIEEIVSEYNKSERDASEAKELFNGGIFRYYTSIVNLEFVNLEVPLLAIYTYGSILFIKPADYNRITIETVTTVYGANGLFHCTHRSISYDSIWFVVKDENDGKHFGDIIITYDRETSILKIVSDMYTKQEKEVSFLNAEDGWEIGRAHV